jgi:hypothetical protein
MSYILLESWFRMVSVDNARFFNIQTRSSGLTLVSGQTYPEGRCRRTPRQCVYEGAVDYYEEACVTLA